MFDSDPHDEHDARTRELRDRQAWALVAKWHGSRSAWRREAARQIEEGVLPLDAVFTLPREMRGTLDPNDLT